MIISKYSPVKNNPRIIGCTGKGIKKTKFRYPTNNRLYIKARIYNGSQIEFSLNKEEIKELKKILN